MLRAGPLAVAQNDSQTASKGLRRGFFDRRPAKPAVAPLPRTPAQKPGSRPAAPRSSPAASRSSIKQGSGVAAENSTDSAQQPDIPRDPPPSFEQQQTAFTGTCIEHSWERHRYMMWFLRRESSTAQQQLVHRFVSL